MISSTLPMHRRFRHPLFIALLSSTLLAAGCSDSDNSNDASAADPEGDAAETSTEAADQPATDGVPVGGPADEDAAVADDAAAPGASGADPASDPTGSAAADEPVPTTGPGAEGQTAADDYSPTATETASLQGPSITDPDRGAGPPSAPGDLVALMTSYDWVEFSWTPSTDDQSVVAYEISRNGELIHTLTGDNEAETVQWRTTSYMDCNYTKNTECVTTQPADGTQNSYTVVAVDNDGLRSPPSEEVTLGLLERTASTVDLSGYTPIFEEEFTGTELDRSKWRTSLAWGADTIVNGEMQYFVDTFKDSDFGYDPFVFNGETLSIEGIPTPPELSVKAQGQPYLSGVISSLDYFSMQYGYLEMSAQLAGGEGLLSTFYLFNDDYERNKPEIDIAEYLGAEPTKPSQTYHYYDSNKNRFVNGEKHSSPTMFHEGGVDYSAGFHTYSVSWEPEEIIWYIDGVEVQRIVGPRVSDEKMHIVAQMVIGSNWIGEPAAGTAFPVKVEIDYVRAYQKAGTGTADTPETATPEPETETPESETADATTP